MLLNINRQFRGYIEGKIQKASQHSLSLNKHLKLGCPEYEVRVVNSENQSTKYFE
jgi:hypothetical protein